MDYEVKYYKVYYRINDNQLWAEKIAYTEEEAVGLAIELHDDRLYQVYVEKVLKMILNFEN